MTKENLKGKSAVGKNLRRKSVFRYALIGQGIIIGVTTGLIIALFRWLLIFADGCRNRLVAYANTGVGPALIAALVMLLLVLVIGWILRKEPESTGSGIPQVEAELLGKKDMNCCRCWFPKSWLRPVHRRRSGTGTGGPQHPDWCDGGKGFCSDQQAGADRGAVPHELRRRCRIVRAFGAPLAGTIFCLEELYRNFHRKCCCPPWQRRHHRILWPPTS